MAKDRLAPISFFEQFPDYLRLHKQVIQDVAAIRGAVRSEVGVIDQIGNTVLSFARRVGSVEPFKGNWRVYAEHTELQHAELTGQPTPFTTWDELVNEYHKDWRRSGLTDPTVFPVAQQILTHTGLWNDNSVRALVLDNLVDRCEVDFFGMENVRQHFVAQVSQGTMSTVEEAQDFLAHIADHVSEMGTKRAIGNIRHFTPKRKMSTEEWEALGLKRE
jgi:ATP:corrinoid adenosyltransferase